MTKRDFQVHGAIAGGTPVFSRKVRHVKLLTSLSEFLSQTRAPKTCASPQQRGREIGKLGHTVRLISPVCVKPYAKRQKNDANDAPAIAETASCPTMRFVNVKSARKQASGMTLRTRDLFNWQPPQTNSVLRGIWPSIVWLLHLGGFLSAAFRQPLMIRSGAAPKPRSTMHSYIRITSPTPQERIRL